MVKYAGIKINDLVVPALSVGQAEENEAVLSDLKPTEGESAFKFRSRCVPLIALAVKRNYPDMTEDQVKDEVDASNFLAFIQAINGVSAKDLLTRGE